MLFQTKAFQRHNQSITDQLLPSLTTVLSDTSEKVKMSTCALLIFSYDPITDASFSIYMHVLPVRAVVGVWPVWTPYC